MPSRNITKPTLKVIFALSGNQCAHPECTNTLIEPATPQSDALVTGHICHIYAISENGPRGKSGLTEDELNSPENLILLCRHHHGIVDGQHETYPAELLKEWKKAHEMKVQKRLSMDLDSIQPDVLSHPYFPIALVDQKIESEVNIIRKSRFFADYDKVSASLNLARRLVERELSCGTDSVRSKALAWCVRFMISPTKELDTGEKYLEIAKGLGECPEIDIADAFIDSFKGNKTNALSRLAGINTPSSRSAALMIIEHHDGSQGVVDWLEKTRIDIADLDPDGKYFLLAQYLNLNSWEAAQGCLEAIIDDDLQDVPALNGLIAYTYLISTVPIELRPTVLKQLPFNAAGFPLASDDASVEARRTAHRHFIWAVDAAKELNCTKAATIADDYALWLELRDLDESDKGKGRLEVKLRDPDSALHFVNLALQFNIPLDPERIEQDIERQIALHGGFTFDSASARLALAFVKKSPEEAVDYISHNYDELAKFFDEKSLQLLQLDLFLQAELLDKANECLDVLVSKGLSGEDESRFRRIITEAKGIDTVEILKEQLKKTDAILDLTRLIDALITKGDWDGVCEYGQIIFGRTHSLCDAENLSMALYNTKRHERLIKFLEEYSEFLIQSKKLHLLYCWALYSEGMLLESRSQLIQLGDDWNNPNYRDLQINLGITLGNWNSISAVVSNECSKIDERSALELINIAELAINLEELSQAKELIFAAAEKGSDDADVLAAAYTLVSNIGCEDEPDVIEWLNTAAILSGDDGPIKKISMEGLLDMKPAWDRRVSETWQLLKQGKIPMCLVAQFLNESLIRMMLFPALANQSQNDPRRRSVVPAYSGKRQPTELKTCWTIGMDGTSLLTLSYLNLLNEALDAFNTIYVPHSTLRWLFEERNKLRFHQQSRIRNAHQLSHLLTTGALEKLSPCTVPDSDLSAQVGEELAVFIAEAEETTEDDNFQRLVVRSPPVYRLGSLMKEEADLTPHESVLCGCQFIVDELRKRGHLTSAEEKKASAFLKLVHEKPWPHHPEISDKAILYLDDLTVNYFLQLGLLEKLRIAGFRQIISPNKITEINDLIFYENTCSNIFDAIERVRFAVNSRIESGKIKVSRLFSTDQNELQSILGYPSIDIISLAGDCDAIITDDRFLNQNASIQNEGSNAFTFSTFELIDALVSTGSITDEERLAYRINLRRAGYFFVPITHDELIGHLNASVIKNGKVVETAELKAIRENILQVRMNSWLQLPEEKYWLEALQKTFFRVLNALWNSDGDIPGIRARSDWLIDLIDIRGWAHAFGSEDGDKLVKNHYIFLIKAQFSLLNDVPRDVKNEFWRWIEERVLIPIKEQNPDIYSCIVEFYRNWVAELYDSDLTGEEIK